MEAFAAVSLPLLMIPDTTPDARRLAAAEGYCELGMWEDAWEELEQLPPEHRADWKVLTMRLQIFVALKRFESAAILAESLVEKGCHLADVYIPGAYGIRRSRSLAAARKFLLAGLVHNPDCATIHYNLACYAAQLGELEEAKERLEKTFALEPAYRAMALEDEDLKPLWHSMATEWPSVI